VVVISLEQRRRGIGAVLLLRNHPAGEVVSCHCRQCDRAGQYRLAAPVERLRRQGPESLKINRIFRRFLKIK
jgi:hypothetical protein